MLKQASADVGAVDGIVFISALMNGEQGLQHFSFKWILKEEQNQDQNIEKSRTNFYLVIHLNKDPKPLFTTFMFSKLLFITCYSTFEALFELEFCFFLFFFLKKFWGLFCFLLTLHSVGVSIELSFKKLRHCRYEIPSSEITFNK